MDKTDIKRLDVAYNVSPARALTQYTAIRAKSILVTTAFLLCGMALAVFLFRSSPEELHLEAYESLHAHYLNSGMIELSLYEGILPLIFGIAAVLSGFSLVPSVPAALCGGVYGFYTGFVSCILYGENMPLCAVYSASAILTALAISLAFSEAALFFRKNLSFARRIEDILKPNCIFGYLKNQLTATAFLLFSVTVHGAALSLAVKYIS